MVHWKSGFQKAKAREAKGEWLTWDSRGGPSLSDLPSGLASAPVLFVDLRDHSEHKLRFVGGLFGVTQDVSTGALQPAFGWAVVHEGAS